MRLGYSQIKSVDQSLEYLVEERWFPNHGEGTADDFSREMISLHVNLEEREDQVADHLFLFPSDLD